MERSLSLAIRKAPFDETELGTAAELCLISGWRLRWVQAENAWYVYDAREGRWKREDREGAFAMAQAAGEMRREALDGPLKRLDQSHVSGALKAAKPLLAITPEAFDRFPTLLNTPAGALDLRSGATLPHAPNALMTKRTRAVFGDAPSQLWLSHLRRLTWGSEETIRLLQIACGAALYGGTDKPQQFIFLRGQGRNGKGVLLRTLKQALGDYFAVVSRGLFTQRDDAIPHEVVRLRNARLAACMEAPRERINAAALNTLTGGDELVGRRLHQNIESTFRPTFLPLWICGNEGLTLDGRANEALWERVIYIDVGAPIPYGERDDTVEPRLQKPDELAGVLAWCLEGWRLFLDNGRRIPTTEAGLAYVDAAKASGDAFGTFRSQLIIDDPNASIPLEDIKVKFKRWCEEHGRPWSDPLTALFDAYGADCNVQDADGRRVVRGIKWSDPQGGFSNLPGFGGST